MSRVGKFPITLPKGVEVKVDGNKVMVKGAKGELSREVYPGFVISVKDGSLVVSPPEPERDYGALHGLTRALLANMVTGVSQGFERNLDISGVGLRAQKTGEKLVFQLGFSHPVEFEPPKGIVLLVEGTNRVKVTGIDREMVGEVAARIRALRKVDHYKGKGIKYAEEKLRLKPGKAGRTAAKK